MIDLREKILEIAYKGRRLASELALPGDHEQRLQSICDSIMAYHPRVMLYGVYNAGKSSLLNALWSPDGQEISPVGAAPTTHRVLEFSLGEYTVFDTPGIDAPLKDEAVARQHLELCHVVLFVVSSRGQFDETLVVNELRRILESRLHLVVVVNDKEGASTISPEVVEKCRQLQKHLASTAQGLQVDEVEWVLVNARRGLEARKRGNSAMLQRSGIPLLETVILKSVTSDRGPKLLLPAAHRLLSWVQEMEVAVRDESYEAPERELLQGLQSRQQEFEKSAAVELGVQEGRIRSRLLAHILSAGPDDLDPVIQDFQKDVLDIVCRLLERSLGGLIDDMAATRLDLRIETAFLTQLLKTLGEKTETSGQDFGARMNDERLRQKAKELLDSELGRESLRTLHQELRKRGWIKGRKRSSKKEVDDMVGGAGHLIDLAMLLVEYRQAAAAEREERERIQQVNTRIQQIVGQMAEGLQTSAMQQVRALAARLFGQAAASVNAKVDAGRAHLDRLSSLQAELQDLLLLLEPLRDEKATH